MKKLFLILALVSLFATSCSKDEETHEELNKMIKCAGCKKVDKPIISPVITVKK